ncbi:GNAT family N-acetyltransferase [Paenibacillus spongiae]|uniref:GNAT family N-acetyltransferase n=1 Tax=Paenibacillus spongiae TaxID=2909671 RepID=A0ABY5SJ25_9BACL|nr:GNAT family N-acetyltransferase [Paenibacillus spongiae]UVI33644.1 GNAT family N-acetyltransferase [Paenibacillus spongiae]
MYITLSTNENIDEAASLFDEYRVFYGQDSDLDGAKKFIGDRMENRESVLFLVMDRSENHAIGFCQLYPSFSSISMKRTWILNDLFVREAYRSRGAAKLLLEAARMYGVQTQAKGIALETAMTNDIAQKLYEKNGYEKDTEFFHYFLKI